MAALLRSINCIKCINVKLNISDLAKRNISTGLFQCNWRRFDSPHVERNLLEGDDVPKNFQLVYRAPLENYVTWTKNVSTVTVSIIGLLAGYNLITSMNFINLVQKIEIASLISKETDLYFFAAGFVLINMAIRVFVAKYPLRIYRNADKYIAVYGSQLPTGTVKHYFERGQITEYKNVLNPWRHITFKLGNRSSMLLIDYFKTPAEFHELFTKDET